MNTKNSSSKVVLARPLDKPIVLVGLMGAGKTTIGRRLAARLNIRFIDTDAEIEAAAGCSVTEIFEKFGEKEFRDGERRVIQRLLTAEPQVLATGGGAFVDPETRANIKSAAYSIWLNAEISLLVERVGRRDTRPLLKKGNPSNILNKLLTERGPLYAEADLIVESGIGPHEEVVDNIIKALNSYRETAIEQIFTAATEIKNVP
jgi:shikimate kinase